MGKNRQTEVCRKSLFRWVYRMVHRGLVVIYSVEWADNHVLRLDVYKSNISTVTRIVGSGEKPESEQLHFFLKKGLQRQIVLMWGKKLVVFILQIFSWIHLNLLPLAMVQEQQKSSIPYPENSHSNIISSQLLSLSDIWNIWCSSPSGERYRLPW